jgi:hypothetical protein
LAKSSWQRALPTTWAESVGKAGARFGGKAQLCQQPGPKLLAKLPRLVGKAQLCQQLWPMLLAKLGIFSPFLLLFSSL